MLGGGWLFEEPSLPSILACIVWLLSWTRVACSQKLGQAGSGFQHPLHGEHEHVEHEHVEHEHVEHEHVEHDQDEAEGRFLSCRDPKSDDASSS